VDRVVVVNYYELALPVDQVKLINELLELCGVVSVVGVEYGGVVRGTSQSPVEASSANTLKITLKITMMLVPL